MDIRVSQEDLDDVVAGFKRAGFIFGCVGAGAVLGLLVGWLLA